MLIDIADAETFNSLCTVPYFLLYLGNRKKTRLPSNLMPTTRECVDLVMRRHVRSRDKDGGHAIRSTVAENPTLHANFMVLSFIEPALLTIEFSYFVGINISTFFVPVTLTLTR